MNTHYNTVDPNSFEVLNARNDIVARADDSKPFN
jgi:hypothetical protein